MPPNALSPPSSRPSPDSGVDDAAQRKKKNADAQAAFRARRANYIATLEETGSSPVRCTHPSARSPSFCTVTNLEKVVVTLQASCREATEDAARLRTENTRLQSEARDREKFWRALWQTRKTGMPPDPADATCLPSYAQSHPSPASSTSSGSAGLLSPAVTAQDGRIHFTGNPALIPPSHPSNYGLSGEYAQQPSPSTSTAATVANGQGEPLGSPSSAAYNGCVPYVGEDASREDNWSPSDMYPAQDCKPGMDGTHSPTFVESPTGTASELTYNTQYASSVYPTVVEATYTTERSLYLFSPSRSVSPALTQASTTSTSSLSATSTSMPTYPFTFPEGAAMQDQPHFSFRQHFTLSGGQACVATAETQGDALRHKLAGRAGLSAPGPARPPYAFHETSSCAEDEYPSSVHSTPAVHFRRNTAPEALHNPSPSRSPSPGPHISGTLAIIKAQTFGALRRTRGRSRPSSEGLAKAAVHALASQSLGLGLVTGPPSKRQRLHAGGAEGTQS